MSIAVNLSQIVVDKWSVDSIQENVEVQYSILDDDDVVWKHDTAVFWRNIPVLTDPTGNVLPTPSNWYAIPTSYLTILDNLTSDIETALVSRVLS